MINCTWTSVIVSPHHILGGGHPGSGHTPSLGFVTALALWAPFPDMLGKTVCVPDVSLGWEQIPHRTLSVTPPVFPAPPPHSSLSQREAASLCTFNIYQLAFLKKTCICRNLGQTTSIEPSEIINNEFMEVGGFSLALSACMSHNKSKNDFPFEKKKHIWPWHNC